VFEIIGSFTKLIIALQHLAVTPEEAQHGLCKVRISYSLYTDFADYTELFRNFTEGTVLSVCSAFAAYKNRVLSSDFATAMVYLLALPLK